MPPAASHTDYLPDDILASVLVLAARKQNGAKHGLRFRGHDFDLQRVFSDLSAEFDALRKYFVFSSTGPIPYSPTLNDSISRLQLSGLIGRENPDYQVVFLRPAAEAYFSEELEPHLDKNLSEELERAAEAFLLKVKA